MAVRLSIGASRWQVVRQLLTESARPGRLRRAVGLLVATWTLQGIVAMIATEDTSFIATGIDGATLLFSAGVTMPPACCSACSPPCTPRAPTSSPQSRAPPASRPAPAPRHASDRPGDHANRAVDDAADPGRLVHPEPDQHQPRRAGDPDRRLVTSGLSPERNGDTPARSKALFERVEDELGAVPA